MTNGQVIVAAFILIGFFAVLAGLIVVVALVFNDLAYRWETRHAARQTQHPDRTVTTGCTVVRLHPATVDEIRPRRGDAA